jgi:hypothetical protein
MLEHSNGLDHCKESPADKYLDRDTLDNYSRAFACTYSSHKIVANYVCAHHDLGIQSTNLKNTICGSKVLGKSDNIHYLHHSVDVYYTFWTPLFSQETCPFFPLICLFFLDIYSLSLQIFLDFPLYALIQTLTYSLTHPFSHF